MLNLDPQNFYTPTLTKSWEYVFLSNVMAQDEQSVLDWAVNVTEKAYGDGMVAKYVDRGDVEQDQDFIDFWAAVTIFYGYFVRLARLIGLDTQDPRYFYLFLEQKNLFNCPTSDLTTYEKIAQRFYSEVRRRGTPSIAHRAVDANDIDGELVRFVCNSPTDEFLFGLFEPYKTGWHVDSSSPTSNDAGRASMLNKAWEKTIDDVTKYPTVGTLNKSTDGDISILTFGSGSGIGGTDRTKSLFVHPELGYEISFLAKGGSVSVSLNAWDNEGSPITLKGFSGDSNSFMTGVALPIASEYYFVRCVIYPFYYDLFPQLEKDKLQQETNMGVGQNLFFKQNVREIIPQIVSASGTVSLYGLYIGPAFLDRTPGFIQSNNFIKFASINRNSQYTDEQIRNAVRYYMLPYDCVFDFQSLFDLDDPDFVIEEFTLEGFLLSRENQGFISGTKLLKY